MDNYVSVISQHFYFQDSQLSVLAHIYLPNFWLFMFTFFSKTKLKIASSLYKTVQDSQQIFHQRMFDVKIISQNKTLATCYQ